MIGRLIFATSFLIAPVILSGQNLRKDLVTALLSDDEEVATSVRRDGLSLDEAVKKITVRAVDLNGDGKPEYILSGLMCGMQNCSYSLYKADGTTYKRIPLVGYFTGIKILATKTNGYSDLLGYEFINCCEGGLQTYQFNGTGYEPTICKIEKYGYTDSRGKYHLYKFPRIQPNCD